MDEKPQSLLEFPCAFPIKAFGNTSEDFEAIVIAIVRRHAPDLAAEAVASRTSGGGIFTAVTVTVEAQSQVQLDAIYQDLTDCPEVIMAL
jgi:putative lipoic acid-binding regulatory protein